MKKEEIFSETEDTKLKQFLTGGRVYSQLAVAIITGIVFLLTVAGMIGVYSNAKQAKNVVNLTGLDVNRDLNGQYIEGSAYKFLAKLGYIADSEKAATYFYYLMYTDAADGNQYLTLVQAPKEMNESLESIIDTFLSYVSSYAADPESIYMGSGLENVTGRFKNMSSQEKSIMSSGISALGLGRERTIDYTLKLGPLPKKTDTVGYWFVAVPFGIALVVSLILFFYGLKLENMRYEANKSPYPYQNRKKK